MLGAVCAAMLSACGRGEDTPKPDNEAQVRATLARFATASAQRDYTTVCNDLLAGALTAKLRSVNVPCEAAIRTGLSEVKKPKLTVTSVQVQGPSATATVRSTAKGQKPSIDLVRLVKERGGWRLASLAEPANARPRPTPPKEAAPEKKSRSKTGPKKTAPRKPRETAPKKPSPW